MANRILMAVRDSRRVSLPLLLVGMAALILAVSILAGLYPAGITTLQLQLLLLITVLLVASLLGLVAGLVSAALGFGLLLWRGMEPAGMSSAENGWTIGLQAVIDAFLWFACAKLAVTLVAVPKGRLARLTILHAAAEAGIHRRELLLDDLSHRMKNDLQQSVSLLQAEAASMTAEPAVAALRAAAGRLQGLGRVHARLAQRIGQEAVVDSSAFVQGLVADLRAGVEGVRPIAFVVSAESHSLTVAAAGDLGLIVNELVTNALKHAFPDGREGIVRVTFRRSLDIYELTVTDSGMGIPSARPDRGGAGLGSRLLRALAAQLGGRLDVSVGEVGGSVCRLRFPVSASATANQSRQAEERDQAEISSAMANQVQSWKRRASGRGR